LSWSRQRSRWWALGAIRNAAPAAAAISATMYITSAAPVTWWNRCVNGSVKRKANSTCTPGSATRSSFSSSISSRSSRSWSVSSATRER
jgi:hypothetical protein